MQNAYTRNRLIYLNLTAATLIGSAGAYTYFYPPDARRANKQILNPATFVPFSVTAKDRVSDTSSILRLRPGDSLSKDGGTLDGVLSDGAAQGTGKIVQELRKQGVWSVEVKQPQLQISRRYTPLPPLEDSKAGAEATGTGITRSETEVRERTGQKAQPANQLPERHRTALSEVEVEEDAELRLFVRRYPEGEVSRYLHAVPRGSKVEVRGPYQEYKIPEDVREVMFLAGGTGIAPALQVAQCLKERAKAAPVTGRDVRMSVLWANRLRGDCLGGTGGEQDPASTGGSSSGDSWTSKLGLSGKSEAPKPQDTLGFETSDKSIIVRQLDALGSRASKAEKEAGLAASRLSFNTRYFVDEDNTFVQQTDIAKALTSRETPEADKARGGKKIILVSGPDGFVEHIAGPKQLVKGVEQQGSLGGLLSRIDTTGWEVWKL